MKIHILFFASVREAVGVRELDLEIIGATVRDALDRLYVLYPATVPLLMRAQVAVNEVYASPETALQDGDTLAVIPPVSGGAR